jgi:hypothetical protein
MQYPSSVARPPAATRAWRLTAGLVAVALLAPADTARAGENKAGAGVAKCVSVAGALLQRQGDKGWRPVAAKDALPAEALLVALPKAEIESANGAVRLAMLADVGRRGPFPVLESAVALHQNAKADLDLTFDRGLIGMENLKNTGAAKVRLRVAGAPWELTLREPGTRVVMELYGRHPAGIPKITDGKLPPPVVSFVMLVLKGSAFIDTGSQGFRLTAPPGPAEFHWDSAVAQPEVLRLEKLPEGIRPLDDKEDKIFQEICACTRRVDAKQPDAVAAELVQSDKRPERLVGVTMFGAIDDVPHLLEALGDAKHADVRDHAVLVLRNWIGRGPGQAEQLYQTLLKRGLTKPRAKSAVQLLFGFDDEQRRRPETYALLIGYLEHSRLGVRHLAHWHLVRLAPAGKAIGYDPAGTEAERTRAVRAWRELIPEGRLPPAPDAPPRKKQ